MGFRHVWVLDSCFPHRDTSVKDVFVDLDFHRFPVELWGFEVNRPQIPIPYIDLPLIASKRCHGLCPFRQCSFDPVTQTDKQTYLIS